VGRTTVESSDTCNDFVIVQTSVTKNNSFRAKQQNASEKESLETSKARAYLVIIAFQKTQEPRSLRSTRLPLLELLGDTKLEHKSQP